MMKNLTAQRLAHLVEKKLKGEEGMALVISLVLLVILALLGASAVITSQIDMEIASNEKVAIQALYAAEAGLDQAVVMLNQSTALGAKIEDADGVTWEDDDTWSFSPTINLTGEDNATSFFNVSVTVAYKRPSSGSCAGQVAFYNQTCGFSDSFKASGGSPVYVVTSRAYKGDFSSEVALELTKQVFEYEIKGGFSAAGDISFTGNVTLDGTPHDANGNPGGTCNDTDLQGTKPGVYTNGSTTVGGAANITPTPSNNNADAPTSPKDVLGLTQTEFDALFGTPQTGKEADGSLSGFTYLSDGYGLDMAAGGNDIGGSGILVVHNPDYSPAAWKTYTDPPFNGSDSGGATCSGDAACELYEASPATYKPANVGIINQGTFKGIIIADKVEKLTGGKIIGALISLSTITYDANSSGNPEILYSCEAIESFAGGRSNFKLNWQRVY